MVENERRRFFFSLSFFLKEFLTEGMDGMVGVVFA